MIDLVRRHCTSRGLGRACIWHSGDSPSTGYGDAAVKLQRDWAQDPQTLPFADNTKSHALVSLIQKGLRYHEVERSLRDVRSLPFLVR